MARTEKNMDLLVKEFILETNLDNKKKLAKKISQRAKIKGIYPSSIQDFYTARGKGELSGFTVPAINLRSMTYDLARAIFRSALKINSSSFIFEIAKSEMGYTDQAPLEYVTVILAAAVKENFSGPVFIQGDHFQVNPKKYKESAQKEIEGIKNLIEEAIDAGFFNIDIDSSTLVDLSKPNLKEQQRLNYEVCAELTTFIRKIEPKGVTVSVGGEIGEVGTKNSTVEDLHAFMLGYRKALRKNYVGISKISIQTGTSHGGVVLPDGSIAQVKLDFDTLKNLSEVARREYGLSGAVQHGASTLPSEAFHKFPETETAEVHLATEFQNMIYESKYFPHDLKAKIYEWLKTNAANEKKEDETEEQFFYKTRKKALGPFKKDIMSLPDETRMNIAKEIEVKFDFLFNQLKINNTRDLVNKYVQTKWVVRRKRELQVSVERDSEGAD